MNKLADFLSTYIEALIQWIEAKPWLSKQVFTPEPMTPENAPNSPQIQQTTPEPQTPLTPLLDVFLSEIQAMEGWYPGSTSYTHNNPGNLRCTPGQEAYWNALANGSSGGFCVFKDEPTGMQGLRNVTIAVCEGRSTTYNNAARHFGLKSCADLTLPQYFVIRDPATDGNDPQALAQRFATKLSVDIQTFTMKDLLS